MFRDQVFDCLFPPTCVVCEEDGAWLCESCRAGIFLERHATTLEPFRSFITLGSYANPRLRLPLTNLKYKAAACLARDLGQLLREFRNAFLDPWPWAGLSEMIVTSIPCDSKRLRSRGLDHGALLARLVQEVLVPWATYQPLLRRKLHTLPNATLPANQIRALNVKDTFEAVDSIRVPVLLVDDVFTTGATATEAARVLLKAGAPEVHFLALAKG